MARNGSGVQSSPGASYPAVSGEVIYASKFNAVINDINAEITRSIASDGQTTITANIPINGYKITGASAGSATGHYVEYDQFTTAIATVSAGIVPAGTAMLFMQASAPTGWTISTAFDGRILAINSGSGGSTGGTHDPLLMNVVPSHTHGFTTNNGSHNNSLSIGGGPVYFNYNPIESGLTHIVVPIYSSSVTNGQITLLTSVHSHTGTTNANGSASNWTPKYATAIVCTKD